eukprot:CAMPEP_0179224644 /NCGR_PEP_ID=MMETSP0797-20121207/7894_1 /TAXON_ID=47934 /ORGANISM="Dinophysis acuminata, Strain DAEP01" /LENGTH=166 /DNA_ID=CAMNT_0020931627 /DNA_START=282 /DNA_END=779 /DNA_ORIENTATION=-
MDVLGQRPDDPDAVDLDEHTQCEEEVAAGPENPTQEGFSKVLVHVVEEIAHSTAGIHDETEVEHGADVDQESSDQVVKVDVDAGLNARHGAEQRRSDDWDPDQAEAHVQQLRVDVPGGREGLVIEDDVGARAVDVEAARDEVAHEDDARPRRHRAAAAEHARGPNH